ncbi:hypothetical protein WN944_014207 [Citrus x changshan-huyou]|uniref:Uncharacterized protein n=1 Tax=Citrus x changshan-huyou TaxID=2935761 RepID=A0AAP0MBR0_9ROSI
MSGDGPERGKNVGGGGWGEGGVGWGCAAMGMIGILVPIANGSEEMEAGGLGSAKAFAKSDKFGKKAIAFPAMYNKLSDQSEIENMVVVDGNLMQRAKNFHGVCTGNCGEVFWPHQST